MPEAHSIPFTKQIQNRIRNSRVLYIICPESEYPFDITETLFYHYFLMKQTKGSIKGKYNKNTNDRFLLKNTNRLLFKKKTEDKF